MSKVLEVRCDSVEEFWEKIQPKFKDERSLIYRGQENSLWRLEPSLYREENKKRLIGGGVDVFDISLSEIIDIQRFVKACDSQGLQFHGDSFEFREKFVPFEGIEGISVDMRASWPDRRTLSVLAVLQHHGSPTRLLDWSRNPLVGAYFAAKGAEECIGRKIDSPKQPRDASIADFDMAVWEVDTRYRNLAENIKFADIPGYVSPNLSAQFGLLMYREETLEPRKAINVNPLDMDLVQAGIEVTKYTLPAVYCLDVLKLCEKHSVTTSFMFPGYGGAAKLVNEKAKRDEVSDFLTEYCM